MSAVTRLSCLVPAIAIVAAGAANAQNVSVAGTATKGGLAPDAQIVHVTTLDDDGPGSLRAAVEGDGPRIVVFDVGGAIQLSRDLVLHAPRITIAGQTAPDPGIELRGASLRIRTHDVVVQHIAVRPGPSASPKISDNLDAISLDGRGVNASYDVRLENVTASWSVDETLSTWYSTTRAVTVRNCIVAEALRNAGHPKGAHSMALLVGTDTTGIEITGNLLAANDFRNPVVGKGGSAYIANNFVTDPGQNAIHFYSRGTRGNPGGMTRVTVLNNVVRAGLDSSNHMSAVQVPPDMSAGSPDAQIYLDGNVFQGADGAPAITNKGGFTTASSSPVDVPAWRLLPADQVVQYVLDHAGSRPAARSSTDAALIAEIKDNMLRIIDTPEQAGGYAAMRAVQQTSEPPADASAPSGVTGKSRLEAWLCLKHRQVGGPSTPECPEDERTLSRGLSGTGLQR